MKKVLSLLIFLYPIVASFTHPLLPGSGLLAGDRVFKSAIIFREFILTGMFASLLIVTLSRSLIYIYVFFVWCVLLMLLGVASTDIPLMVQIRITILIGVFLLLPFAVKRAPSLLSPAHLSLKIIIITSFILSLIQIGFIPAVYGSTFLGPRVFAGMASPLHLSYAAGASALFFATRRQVNFFWIALCLCLCLMTGGRAGILIGFVAFGTWVGKHFVAKNTTKLAVVASFAILLVALSFAVSNPAISGREDTSGGPLEDGRFEVWVIALRDWLDGDILEVLFGSGLGSGSNALSAYVDNFAFTDSTFVFSLLSFGFAGTIYLAGLIYFNFATMYSVPVFIAWVVAALTQQTFELQPFIIILALCLEPATIAKDYPTRKDMRCKIPPTKRPVSPKILTRQPT